MPASATSPTTSQRAASSAPPAGVLPPAGGITCPSPQKTPTTRREILVALGETPALPGTGDRSECKEMRVVSFGRAAAGPTDTAALRTAPPNRTATVGEAPVAASSQARSALDCSSASSASDLLRLVLRTQPRSAPRQRSERDCGRSPSRSVIAGRSALDCSGASPSSVVLRLVLRTQPRSAPGLRFGPRFFLSTTSLASTLAANSPMQLLDLTLPTPAENLAGDEALLDWREAEPGPDILRFWTPDRYFVVVGYANKVAREVDLEACRARQVPILRRCTGGGAVLQGPGCLNYALILNIEQWPGLRSIAQTNCFIMQRQAQALSSLPGRAASSSPSSPREEQVGRGPRRGETNKNAPPLPSPLVHPMEEREKSRSLMQSWSARSCPRIRQTRQT